MAGSTTFPASWLSISESNSSKNPSSNTIPDDSKFMVRSISARRRVDNRANGSPLASLFNLQSTSSGPSGTSLDAAIHHSTSSSTSGRTIDELAKSAMSIASGTSSLPPSSSGMSRGFNTFSGSAGGTGMAGSMSSSVDTPTSALGSGTVSMTRVITMMLTSPSSSVSRPHVIEVRNNASFLNLPNQAAALGDLVLFSFLEHGISLGFHLIDGSSVDDDGAASSMIGRAIYSAGIHVNGMSPVNVNDGPLGSVRRLTTGVIGGNPMAQTNTSVLSVTYVPSQVTTSTLSEGSRNLLWSWVSFLAIACHLIS